MGFPKALTGARAILNMNNDILAFATDCSYQVETENRPIRSIDNSLPEEISPGGIMVQVVCTLIRVPLHSASVITLQSTIANNLNQPYTSIEIKDRGTDQTILYVPSAQMVRRAGAIRSRGLATETWTFVGIGYWDEREPEGVDGVAENTGAVFPD